ncbi:hypothetical protein KO361_02785 [Candidatus Woesearchaeota archaeon]|nr:hypothetical protein [Candidatus Woesearchaeota archaeon]
MFTRFLNYAFKNALNYNEKEATTIIIISILSGFILSFRKWGTEQFDANEGLNNLILYSILFLILFLIFLSTQKFTASLFGLEARVHVWKYGPPLGVLVTMMSYGVIPFVFLGGVKIKEIPRLRLGIFRSTVPRIKDIMIIGMTGPIMLILLSILIFFPLYQINNSEIMLAFIRISSLILVVSAIPMPSLNGINILLKSRTIWLFYALYSIILYFLLYLLINVTQHAFIYLLALILTIIAAWLIKHSLKGSKHK